MSELTHAQQVAARRWQRLWDQALPTVSRADMTLGEAAYLRSVDPIACGCIGAHPESPDPDRCSCMLRENQINCLLRAAHIVVKQVATIVTSAE